ncbi:MAG: hypothetical protein E7334_08030 [Clostridiales bacterium]|nr:hypothetical protein [Clostridiales bacterium]
MNKTALIDALMSEYAKERNKAIADAENRRAIIAQKAPIYANFEAEMARTLHKALELQKTDPEAARKAIFDLKAESERQLRDAGYTKEDLLPRFKCSVCEDTGMVGMPEKHYCECFKKRLNLMMISDEDVNIPASHCFENYDENIFPETAGGVKQRDIMRRAKKWALDYCEKFPNNEKKNVVILGDSGLGKTYIQECITRRLIEKGHTAMFISSYRLGEIMRERYFGKNDPDAEDKFELCMNVDFLAIDDLGAEPMFENITIEYLYAIVCERERKGKPFMITTNLSMTELGERYTERLLSRLVNKDNYVIRLEGKDIRMA